METNIRIDKNSIFEQVAKKTSYIGSKMNNEDAYDRIAVTDADMEFFEEPFELALAECFKMLSAYTKGEMTKNEDRNMEDTKTPSVSYNIMLTVPEDMLQATAPLVKQQINEYIVSRLIAEWMMASNVESHSYWIERYTSIRTQINRALTARTQPVRRVSRPF